MNSPSPSPAPIRRGLPFFPIPSPPDTPTIPSQPTYQPKKNQRFVSVRNRPLYTASHRLFAIRFPFNTPSQNPDAPTRPKTEFQLDLRRRTTSSETDDRHQLPRQEGVDRPKKRPKVYCRKKAEVHFQEFSAENR